MLKTPKPPIRLDNYTKLEAIYSILGDKCYNFFMFIIRQIIKLIRLLHQNEGAFLLAFGFSLGVFAGFSGWVSILGVSSALIALFFRVQLGAYILGTVTFALISYPFIGLFHKLGERLLHLEALQGVWTKMYEYPIFHWLKYNYTVTMGASLVSLCLFPLLLVTTYALVIKYQQTVLVRLKQTKVYKAFMKSSLVLLYMKYLDQLEA